MMTANFASGLEVLLHDKNVSIESRRRIVATNAALELIAVAIQQEKSDHELSKEVKNLQTYTDAIVEAMSGSD